MNSMVFFCVFDFNLKNTNIYGKISAIAFSEFEEILIWRNFCLRKIEPQKA